MSDSSSDSSCSSVDISEEEEMHKDQFIRLHAVNLRLGDYDQDIKVPNEMLEYDSMSEDSNGDEGPFLKLKLKDVKRLIQNHSASNSQNIENIKYFVEDHGVWRDL